MLRFLLVLSTFLVGIHAVAYNLQAIEGARTVKPGSITHCGTNSGQQCFYVEPNLSYLGVKNPDKVDIACDDANNLCVIPIDVDKGQKAHLQLTCFGSLGMGNVTIEYEKHGCLRDTYGKFEVLKDGMQLKWGSDAKYTVATKKPEDVYSYKKADSLFISCEPKLCSGQSRC